MMPPMTAPETPDTARTFTTIGVVGLGTMGAGIAEVFARHGYAVVGVEKDDEGVARGRRHLEASTGRAVAREKLTQDEADKPDAGFFSGEKNDDCTYDEFDRSGGKLKLRMTCDTDESGGSAKIAMDGKFGRDSFTMTMSNVISGSENGDVTMKGTISGKRIGDCAG